MWLIITALVALVFTAIWYKAPKKYHLEIPAFMFWGSTIMILVDHILGYEGGAFIEMETEGLVTNSIILSIFMILPVLLFWVVYLLVKKPLPTIQTR